MPPSIYATAEQKSAYFAKYRRENRVKLRAYHKTYMRNYRAKQKTK